MTIDANSYFHFSNKILEKYKNDLIKKECEIKVGYEKLYSERILFLEKSVEEINELKNINKSLEQENKIILAAYFSLQEKIISGFDFENKLNKNSFEIYGAENRFKNHLNYRVGSIIIKNYKVIYKAPLIPFFIFYEIIKYKKEKNNMKGVRRIPISSYADYMDGLKVKQHLSYTLGESILKKEATIMGWLIKPYEIFKTIKNFNNK